MPEQPRNQSNHITILHFSALLKKILVISDVEIIVRATKFRLLPETAFDLLLKELI